MMKPALPSWSNRSCRRRHLQTCGRSWRRGIGLRAYQDAESAVLALGLELRNKAGQAVRDVSIQVMEWQLFASRPDSERMLTEAAGVRQGHSTRGFVMRVTRARPTTTPPPVRCSRSSQGG